jgi:hypothetical protein
MGLCDQGIFGAWRNKVGNVVGRVRQGRNVYSIYQPQVANPKSFHQLRYRRIFAEFARLAHNLLPILRIGFTSLDGYRYGSAYSSFVGYNIKYAYYSYDDIAGAVIIYYDTVTLSVGNVPLPYNPIGTLDGSDFNIRWRDNTGEGVAAAEDVAFVCVYNPIKSASIYDGKYTRAEQFAVIQMPAAWSGDTVKAWLFMRDAKGNCSGTHFLGSFDL